MKLKNKPLALVFAFVLLIASLTSCSNFSNQPNNTDTESDLEAMLPESDTKSNETSNDSRSDDAENTNADLENAFVYVALGDSIAYGYGLIDFDNERYSALIDSELSETGNYASFNYAVNGDDSNDLIDLIKSGGAPELKYANLVTISIGANNVLATSLSKLYEYYLYESSVSDENLKNTRIPLIYDEMMTENEAGIERFSTDIVTIIDLIRETAPDAQIVFQTIYNPYRKLDISFDFIKETLNLAAETDRLVTSLNEIIVSNADSLGYDIADVYSKFEQLDNVVNADTFSGDVANFATSITEADPHPNANGHRIIAEIILPLIKSN